MSPQPYIPLGVAVLLVAALATVPLSLRADRVFSRIAARLFGPYVTAVGRKRSERTHRLRTAHIPATYRGYATKTLLYAAVMAVVGGIVGLYLIWWFLRLLAIDPARLRAILPPALEPFSAFAGLGTISVQQLLTLLIGSGLTVGAVAGGMTYWLRWWWPKHRAATRRRQIEATMPQTVAFMYALSRSGMEFPKIMEILRQHRHVYGASADEVGVAVRHMDLFGRDMITAIQTMGRESPSEQFAEFSENVASVLQSGRSLPEFLEQQYEDFREEAEAQQRELLEFLATLAEAYVTLLVVGPLFLITILVIVAIAAGDTTTMLQVVVYFLLPVANLGFIVYMTTVLERFGGERRIDPTEQGTTHAEGVRRVKDDTPYGRARTDGGVEAKRSAENIERIRVYKRLRWLLDRLGSPVRTVIDRPITILYVTVPLAAAVTLLRLASADSLTIHVVDDLLVQAVLFVVGTFALAYEIHTRRIQAIERSVPDFLDRLASVNEAGMTVIDSLDRVRKSDLGALNPELDRTWADITWGATVGDALKGFERRVRTRTVARIVALVTNAMNASGNIARVLRIAAEQAKADRRLKRRRRQEMLTYLVVVYISFLVFLLIVGVLNSALIPNLPDTEVAAGGDLGQVPGGGDFVDDIGAIDEAAYQLLFFHTAIIQGLLSGLIAGQMSAGDIRNGAKHGAIMMAIAYAAFLLVL